MSAATKKPKRRRSSKRRPMTMTEVRRFLTEDGIVSREEMPVAEVRLEVPMKKADFRGKFHVIMSDGKEKAYLRCSVSVSVSKERVGDALRLLRRLHEMR
jgi:hypothetical protein